jgi:hypothetical protein
MRVCSLGNAPIDDALSSHGTVVENDQECLARAGIAEAITLSLTVSSGWMKSYNLKSFTLEKQ